MKLRESRAVGFAVLAAIYVLAWGLGFWLFRSLPFDFWLNLLLADAAATALVFGFSAALDNASVYDPYWSVFPVAAMLTACAGRALTPLNIIHLAAISLWGLRLTANWAYTFHGLGSQDWRYTMLKEKTGPWYPAVNFLGIHLAPTLIVYGCTLPALLSLRWGLAGDALSLSLALLSFGAVALQGTADWQLHAFRRTHRGQLIRTGLWKHSRHPNYLGEILMWWGVGLSAAAAVRGRLWLLSGAAANTLLFLFISIPMADQRQSRKEGYAAYRDSTRMLLPLRRR